jgi:hypothetical protein
MAHRRVVSYCLTLPELDKPLLIEPPTLGRSDFGGRTEAGRWLPGADEPVDEASAEDRRDRDEQRAAHCPGAASSEREPGRGETVVAPQDERLDARTILVLARLREVIETEDQAVHAWEPKWQELGGNKHAAA